VHYCGSALQILLLLVACIKIDSSRFHVELEQLSSKIHTTLDKSRRKESGDFAFMVRGLCEPSPPAVVLTTVFPRIMAAVIW
jgi:hypothetical protein